MTRLEWSAALHGRVREFARARLAGEASESFEDLALDIARFQEEHNPVIAKLASAARAQGRAARAESAAPLAAVPALPADAFRLARVAAHPPVEDVASFQTSGTTGGAGRHPFRTLETYRASSLAFGARALGGGVERRGRVTVLALAQPFEPARRSSLGYMMQELMRELDGRALTGSGAFDALERGRWLVGADGVDLAALRLGIAAAERRGEPVWLLATSFALVWLLDALAGARLPLPAGSRIMQTGGFKGHTRTLDEGELARELEHALGVPPARIIGEYGMTELSSQLYDGGFRQGPNGESVFVEPPWLRVTPVDPVSFEPVPEGEVGLAEFTDLANVDSALKVLTQDRVRRAPGGIVLLGRRPGVRLRGCSLAVEALMRAPSTLPLASTGSSAPTPTEPAQRTLPAAQPDPSARERVERLLAAARRITRAGSPEREALVSELAASTGLSRAGVELALERHLELQPSREELDTLLASVPRAPRAHVILPANVFIAAHRALALALAASPRVSVKPSRREPVFVTALARAEPGLFERVTQLAVTAGEHVWAYGHDVTLAQLRQTLPAGSLLHAQGAGFGVAVVDLAREGFDAEAAAEAIARDTVAFDQRGCASPRLIFCIGARGLAGCARAFAASVAEALARWESRVPRGRLDPDEAADAAWYQRTAAATAELYGAGRGSVALRVAGDGGASSHHEPASFQLEVPPVGRHLELIALEDVRPALDALAPWLTAAASDSAALRVDLGRWLPRARVAPLGELQRPAFDGPVDLRSPLHGEQL